MKIFSRQRCGLKPPRSGYGQRGKLTHASIHHGGEIGAAPLKFSAASARWRQFQQWHFARNWSDVGYHFGIDRMGRLYEGRPTTALPAAVGNHNTGQIAFVFMQDGRYHKLNWMQRRTLKNLFEKGIPSKGVPPLKKLATHPGRAYGVFGHQEYSGHTTNACPGGHIMRHLRWRRGRY